ncbi:MAG: HlyD family efflux transporter periplasmic adaptor subunit [Rhodomicrobium sp.]|jgi:multidrug resistance efflux pump
MAAPAEKNDAAFPKEAPRPPKPITGAAPPVHLLADAGKREAYLSSLLYIEQRARDASSKQELSYVIVNDSRKISGSRQTFLIDLAGGEPKAAAISDVAVVDRAAPFVQWAERLAARLAEDGGLAEARMISLSTLCGKDDSDAQFYPFQNIFWAPFKARGGEVFAGCLLAREEPWNEPEKAPILRLAGTFQHAWLALSPKKKLKIGARLRHWLIPLGACAAIGIFSFPVPLTALAPVEVVAKNPLIIAAPFDGVIDEIVVEPNAPVRNGQGVVRFVDTVFRNKALVAEKSVEVASAKYRRDQQAAMQDQNARHDMAIARAELGLALSERDYAQEVLSKANLTAPADGIAIFANKDSWRGRPVSTGEQILQIADPASVEFRIDLPVRDAIVLKEGAEANVYLDAFPLDTLKARVTHASYQAEAVETQKLAYRIRAEIAGNAKGLPARIGSRGTAQIYGEPVPLIFYLLRRPISVIRQSIGL